jgi:endonuclease/exonuclease/phosphatase family metal-dependent hydrolase
VNGELTIVSYNVHRCVGTDMVHDPDRIVRVLRGLEADVIGLQEVDSRASEDSALHQLRYIADALDMHAIAGPTLMRGHGMYGNGLLTRLPVSVVQWIDLSQPHREPRGAIDARLEVDGATVRVIATHLGLGPSERRAQIKKLVSTLAAAPEPLVLLGDINEWLAWGRPLRYLHRAFGQAPGARSFPSVLPLFKLDRVWVRPNAALRELEVARSDLTRVASDHLPVRARVDLDRLRGMT